MPSLAVTVIGRDRPGIIAEVTGVLADLGGNLEDSSMTLLRGHFTWTLIVDIDATAEDLGARLAHLGADGLVVSVLPVGPEEACNELSPGTCSSVHGADRPGIVAGVTSTLAKHGRQHHRPVHATGPGRAVPAHRRGEPAARRRRGRPRIAAVRGGAEPGRRGLAASRRLRRPLAVMEDLPVALRLPMPELPAGRVLPVVAAPHSVLDTRCTEVDPTDPDGHPARRGPDRHHARLARVRRPGCQPGRGRLAGLQPRRRPGTPRRARPTGRSCS